MRAIDRAPLHALRTTFVAERLGFRRDEALTFGRAVAGLRAYARGGSPGIFRPTPQSLDARGNAMQHDERIRVGWRLDFALAAQSRAAPG